MQRVSRRMLAGLAATGIGLSVLPAGAQGAMSSAAGVVAGGSLEGDIQFSAFATRISLDDADDPVVLGALQWYDPTGFEDGPLTLQLVSTGDYGPGSDEFTRVLSGTASVNGGDQQPFVLWLEDRGTIGEVADWAHIAVGSAALLPMDDSTPEATPAMFDYEREGALLTGDVQLISFEG